MALKKQFKDLDLNNAFLFSAALEHPEICALVLECILGKPQGNIRVKTERSILFDSDFRCVRLDVYASDEMDVAYNLEMQNVNEKNLPKRSRYHQAEMDVSSLKPGQDFNDLRPSIIVFICNFDPFGKKKYQYTFEPRCLEEDFSLDDGTKRIFLNTKGENESEVPTLLVHFLHYVGDSSDHYVEGINDEAINKLHARIKALKESRRLEERYMQFQELLDREHSEGVEEGKKEGTGITLALVTQMLSDGLADDVIRLQSDEDFYQTMLKKYKL